MGASGEGVGPGVSGSEANTQTHERHIHYQSKYLDAV